MFPSLFFIYWWVYKFFQMISDFFAYGVNINCIYHLFVYLPDSQLGIIESKEIKRISNTR